MSTAEFLHHLSEHNIRIRLDGDELKIHAPKGVLNKDLQLQLKEKKQDIIDWFKRNTEASGGDVDSLPQAVPDLDNLYQPFPLSDLQVAFYLSNDAFMEFQVRPHYYMEDTHCDLDVERYQHAWNKALQRHKKELVLINDQEELQVIRSLPPLEIPINDYCHLEEKYVSEALQSRRNALMRQEQPLTQWPWFHLEISVWQNDSGKQYRIHYNNNNFYSDGLGTTKFINEIWQYYHKPDLQLPELTLSFRDAVLALEKLDQSDIGKKSQDYWISRIDTLPGPPPVPVIAGKNRRCRSKLNRREFFVDKQSWKNFKKRAGEHGVTASNVILTAHAKIISLWSGSDYFILSHMMTRRLAIHPEIKEILGNFASLYPLEVDFREPKSFAEHAKQIQQQVLTDSSHANWGGMKVMRELNRLKGEMGTSPCPYVVGSGIFMGGYNKPEFSCLETSQTLLDHQFWELTDESFYGVWDLLEEFFPEGMIDSMWAAYQKLFMSLANEEQTWQNTEFDLTPEKDLIARNQCNQTATDFSGGLLHEPLAHWSENTPDALAVVASKGSLTYRELHYWSQNVAAELIKNGVALGDKVAVVMDRDIELLPSLLGVLAAGAAYVPVNPELPLDRKDYLIRNSEAKVVLTQEKYQTELDSLSQHKTLAITGQDTTFELPVLPEINESDLAYIIYTSGSTGQPKGVAIDHRGAVNTIQDVNQRFAVQAGDRILGVSAYSFDLSVYDAFGVIQAGATLIYPDPESAFNPTHWIKLMIDHQVSVWNSAPPLMTLLAEAALRQNAALPDLKVVMLSGDWIPTKLPQDIHSVAKQAKIYSLGGATEASIWSIYYPVDEVNPEWRSIPYGYPMANQRWYILDKFGYPAPAWVPGELFIAGKGLAIGYWGDKEKTEKSFFIHSQTGERLYRTGDQGRYLPDGCIEFLGRLDSQVKIQGHRIELGEIESALRQCGGVAENIVMAVEVSSHLDKKLVAYVIPEKQAIHSSEEFIHQLENQLREILPAYMVPKSWAILDAFPVTANGKIDRKALVRIDTQDKQKSTMSNRALIAPRNDIEQEIYSCWAQILKHEQFGVTCDFFDLGGQSFDAVRIMGVLQERFSRPLSLGDMWRERTIENLADILQNENTQAHQCLVEIKKSGTGEPWFLVHPAGGYCIRYTDFAQEVSQPVYGLQAVGLNGKDAPLSDIKQIASTYIEEIKQVQPKGPYRIGGWSSGGLIAFEIVTQLLSAGDKVHPLLIIDCPSPHEHHAVTDLELLQWFMEDLDLNLPTKQLETLELSGLSTQKQLSLAVDLLNSHTGENLDAKSLWPIFNVFSHIVLGGRNYYPESIQTDIVLCRAADHEVSEFAHHPYKTNDDWGWSLLTHGAVYSRRLPGTHYTLLDKNKVHNITQTLNEASLFFKDYQHELA